MPNNFVRDNHTLLCDFYELTMGNGYLLSDMADRISYFDVFFRTVPNNGGFAITAGLEQVIDYIEDLRFSESDLEFLRGKGVLDEDSSPICAISNLPATYTPYPRGHPSSPAKPIMTVRAPAIQAQFIETFVLLTLNHQSLIATKASRIVRAADGRPVSEFGSRRAQGADGAILGARASYIAGCTGLGLHDCRTALRRSRRRHDGGTRGCRCSTTNMPPSTATARFTPTRPPCWSIPTTCSPAACQTPSGLSRRTDHQMRD